MLQQALVPYNGLFVTLPETPVMYCLDTSIPEPGVVALVPGDSRIIPAVGVLHRGPA